MTTKVVVLVLNIVNKVMRQQLHKMIQGSTRKEWRFGELYFFLVIYVTGLFYWIISWSANNTVEIFSAMYWRKYKTSPGLWNKTNYIETSISAFRTQTAQNLQYFKLSWGATKWLNTTIRVYLHHNISYKCVQDYTTCY